MRSYAFSRVRYESPTIKTVEINVAMNVITHCILTKRAGKRKVKLSVEKTQHLCNSLQINEVGKTQHVVDTLLKTRTNL